MVDCTVWPVEAPIPRAAIELRAPPGPAPGGEAGGPRVGWLL